MIATKAMWKSLFAFISLFLSVTPFEILFGCGRKEGFDDSFLKSFKLPPQRNLRQRVFFFPLTFNDFVVFLYRTSELKESTTAMDPAFFHLHQSIKSATFQSFLSKHDALNLSTNYQLEFTSQNYPKDSSNQTTFERYEKWWSQTNYLYLFCFKESFVLEKDKFSGGFSGSCYRVKNINSNGNSLSIDASKRMIFKSVRLFKTSAYEVGLSGFVDLQELKLSLFFEFEKCPHIHPLICLVVSDEKDKLNVPVGYLCEEAELGSLKEFLASHMLFGNYACFLRGIFHIAEAIQFLHEHGIIHGDIFTGNVLLFSDGNEIRMKLIDFGESKTIEEYKLKNESTLKTMKRYYLENKPELIELKSFDEKAVFRDDWNDYAKFLAEVFGDVMTDEETEFEEILKLITLLKGNNYWKLENILETIREYIDKEIEKCSVTKEFYFELA